MRLIIKLKLFLIVFFIAATSFAQTDKLEPLPITASRNTSVSFAISHTALVVNIINRCKALPVKLSKNPVDVFARWQQRNGPYFEAAQGWVMYVASSIKGKQGQEKADEFTKTVIGQARESAETLAEGFFTKEEPPQVCEKWFQILLSPQSDIIAHQESRKDLQEILEFHKSVISRYKERGMGR